MDSTLHHSNRGTSKWKKRTAIHPNYRIPLLLTFFIILVLFFSTKTLISSSVLPLSRNSGPLVPPQCHGTVSISGEKFLWYAPHSGFSNQLSEFKNAILIAAILNRTLIVPPVLDHHAVALGSCPKFRVLDPNELRFKVWNHCVQLIRHGRQVIFSMISIVIFPNFNSSDLYLSSHFTKQISVVEPNIVWSMFKSGLKILH